MTDQLIIGGKTLPSRLFVGTGKYSSNDLIPEILKSSNASVITVALRRVNLDADSENILKFIPKGVQLLPNTSGARNAEEAIRIARLSRALGCGDWIKIEIINDNKYLLPDGYETIKATEILVKEGFTVLPYISPDLSVARSLESVGASTVMPLGSPIGTNRGLETKELIRIIIEEIKIPVIVDAGIGKPSDACEAMEMGAAACLLNTAIASSNDPVLMAKAFGAAVSAGRTAYLAGLGERVKKAQASSPLTGFLNE